MVSDIGAGFGPATGMLNGAMFDMLRNVMSSIMTDIFTKKKENEDKSKAFCARLQISAFTDELGRVRAVDGLDRAMVPKSEKDRIKHMDLTPMCVLKLNNFQDNTRHNNCRAIFLGCDHETKEDGEKVFLYYIIGLDEKHSDTCNCPCFCNLHGMGPMSSAKVSRISGIEHDSFSVKENMRYLIERRIFDPFKENKAFVLSDKDKFVLVGTFDNPRRKFFVFSNWINDFLPRDPDLPKPQIQTSETFLGEEDEGIEDNENVEWKSWDFAKMLEHYRDLDLLVEGSFYHRLFVKWNECLEPPSKRTKFSA